MFEILRFLLNGAPEHLSTFHSTMKCSLIFLVASYKNTCQLQQSTAGPHAVLESRCVGPWASGLGDQALSSPVKATQACRKQETPVSGV